VTCGTGIIVAKCYDSDFRLLTNRTAVSLAEEVLGRLGCEVGWSRLAESPRWRKTPESPRLHCQETFAARDHDAFAKILKTPNKKKYGNIIFCA
jgi:hypothetical protein